MNRELSKVTAKMRHPYKWELTLDNSIGLNRDGFSTMGNQKRLTIFKPTNIVSLWGVNQNSRRSIIA